MLGRLLQKLFGGRGGTGNAWNDEAWKEWSDRRLAAEEAGEPFSDPAPATARKRGR